MVAFSEEWYLETKCLSLAVLIATGVLCLLWFFFFHSKDIVFFSQSENPSFQQFSYNNSFAHSYRHTQNSFRIAAVTLLSLKSLLRKVQALFKFFLSLDWRHVVKSYLDLFFIHCNIILSIWYILVDLPLYLILGFLIIIDLISCCICKILKLFQESIL